MTVREMYGYLGKGGRFESWKGKKLGTYRIVSSWRTSQSHVSSKMYQVEVTVNGITYTGRSAGVGMLFKGKEKKTGR